MRGCQFSPLPESIERFQCSGPQLAAHPTSSPPGERGGGGGVSVPVGTSGCTHWFGFSPGNCLHCPQTVGKAGLVGESGIVFLLLVAGLVAQT